MNEIIAFHGSDSKAGVTMIAQSVAQQLAKDNPDKKIVFISMCSHRNNQYNGGEPVSLDQFRDQIFNNLDVDKKEFSKGRLADNLYVIDGPDDTLEALLYYPSDASNLFNTLKKQFDYIIVDTGSELISGLAVGTLNKADRKYMVFPQGEASLQRFARIRGVYDSIGCIFDGFIINKYAEGNPFSVEYFRHRTELNNQELYLVSDTDEWRRAEFERKTFYDMHNRKFIKEISSIAASIGGVDIASV